MQGSRGWVSSLLMVRNISCISRYASQLPEQIKNTGEQGSGRSQRLFEARLEHLLYSTTPARASHHTMYEPITRMINIHIYLKQRKRMPYGSQ